MVDSVNYVTAWLIYLGAAGLLLLLWWRLTESLPTLLRTLLRVLPAAWVLAPVANPSHPEWLVPALIVTTLGSIADGWETGARGAAALALATLLALVLWGVDAWRRRRSTPAGADRQARMQQE